MPDMEPCLHPIRTMPPMKLVLLALISFASCTIQAQDLAIANATVYASPEAQPATDTTVLIHAGKITVVGKHLTIPPGLTTLSCNDCIVLAGFWNNHIHLTEPKWNDAAHQPAEQLTRQLQQMLTHSGFVTIVDTGSDPGNTLPLRQRIE